MTDDRIHIEQLEIYANVGVPDVESATKQRLLVDLTLAPRNEFRQLHDSLEQTVDYAAVCETVKEIVADRSFKLIETLADEVASLVRGRFAVGRVDVEVRKFILPDTAYVAVRTSR